MLSDTQNGFEGWLKLEFLMWLSDRRSVAVGGPGADVGLEYKARLDGRSDSDGDEWKQCDMWIRAPDGLFHYIEFKTPFANGNAGKMLRGAGADYWYMRRLRAGYEQAATGSAIVLGVGFDEKRWTTAREHVRGAAGIEPNSPPNRTGLLGKAIRYDVWTYEYRNRKEPSPAC
ncbi:MAG: hypothetical protein ACHREM_05740 [Polyangiales bacterium]